MVPKNVLKNIGKKLRALRKQHNLKLKDISEKTGLTQSHISMIENSKTTPSLQTLAQLSGLFNVEITYFFETRKDKDIISISHENYQLFPTDESYSLKLITPPLLNNGVNAYDLETNQKSRIKLPPQLKGTLFIYCLQGEFKLVSARSTFRLPPTDTIIIEDNTNFKLYSETDVAKCFVIQILPR
ncbi:helix-turn-helix domain-containing protein [candidate division CSSED10-310 bacterium]|uniref:Helix-turn-helix domain-containing protein n=1 Tax=candidate division CSSED10-310 bacterium TaxID=2855610 RepID=A0ABV6Z1Y3_UNCC1